MAKIAPLGENASADTDDLQPGTFEPYQKWYRGEEFAAWKNATLARLPPHVHSSAANADDAPRDEVALNFDVQLFGRKRDREPSSR